jgi:hypothetical protein
VPNSAAASVLQDGDVIVKIQKRPVAATDLLPRLALAVTPGHQLLLTVLRHRREMDFRISVRILESLNLDHFPVQIQPSLWNQIYLI